MKAVVLVGGQGTRMRPLTHTIAKPMLPVVGVSIIERVIAHLVPFGIDEVVLSLGYQPDAFLQAFPDGTAAGARLHYAIEDSPLDTAGAIRFAALSAGVDDTFVVLNGDVLSDLDVGDLLAFHRSSGAEATISLTPVEDPSRFGVVPTDSEGRVEAFIEKPPPGTAPTNLINAGAYVLEALVLDRIPDGRKVSVERETFPAIVAEKALYARASREYWLDLGTPASYLQANTDLLTGVRAGVDPAGEAVVVRRGLWVCEGATVPELDAGTLSAVYVGADGSIEGGASVSASVVGTGASVAAGAMVQGSVLLPFARVAEDAVVIDTVLGPGAVVGKGARLVGGVIGADAEVPAGADLTDARIPSD